MDIRRAAFCKSSDTAYLLKSGKAARNDTDSNGNIMVYGVTISRSNAGTDFGKPVPLSTPYSRSLSSRHLNFVCGNAQASAGV